MKKFEEKIKDKLKKYPNVVLEITDNFIECGLLDIDTVEQILCPSNDQLKEAAIRLVEFVIAHIHRGAFNRLFETLKSVKTFADLVFELTQAGAGENTITGTLYYYN
jgi:hypothetical protein